MRQVLAILRHGGGDPTFRTDDDGTVWRGVRTPEGTATLRLRQDLDGSVHASAWGSGATWVLDAVPAMLGAHDDPTGFAPTTARSPTCTAATRTGGSPAPAW